MSTYSILYKSKYLLVHIHNGREQLFNKVKLIVMFYIMPNLNYLKRKTKLVLVAFLVKKKHVM